MSGIEVKNIREKLGITQVELAEKLGVTQAALSQWESGKRKPSGPVVVLLRQLDLQDAKKKIEGAIDEKYHNVIFHPSLIAQHDLR